MLQNAFPFLPFSVFFSLLPYTSRPLYSGVPDPVPFHLILGDFRFEYEYEIDYECDFSNPQRILKIIKKYTNIVPKAFTPTDQQQGEARALGT